MADIKNQLSKISERQPAEPAHEPVFEEFKEEAPEPDNNSEQKDTTAKPTPTKQRNPFNVQGFFTFLAILAFLGVLAVGGAAVLLNETDLLMLFAIIGGVFFFPLGAVLGGFLLDPQKRVRAMRSVLKKNFGLVGFISRGKQIKYMIKNLDNDLLWIKNQVWLLHNNAIYWQDKTAGEGKKRLETSHFYQIGGVPTIFIDIDSVEPRIFEGEESKIKPQELGSGTQSYIANERAKALLVKRTLQVTGFITLVGVGLTLLFSFLTWDLANNQGVVCRTVSESITQG